MFQDFLPFNLTVKLKWTEDYNQQYTENGGSLNYAKVSLKKQKKVKKKKEEEDCFACFLTICFYYISVCLLFYWSNILACKTVKAYLQRYANLLFKHFPSTFSAWAIYKL